MKKILLYIWLVISSILVLASGIELCYGISLWAKEQNLNFWGSATITQFIIFIIGLVNLIMSIVFLVKRNKK